MNTQDVQALEGLRGAVVQALKGIREALVAGDLDSALRLLDEMLDSAADDPEEIRRRTHAAFASKRAAERADVLARAHKRDTGR